MIDTKILEALRGEDILLLVADLIYDRIDLPGEGASVFSGDIRKKYVEMLKAL